MRGQVYWCEVVEACFVRGRLVMANTKLELPAADALDLVASRRGEFIDRTELVLAAAETARVAVAAARRY